MLRSVYIVLVIACLAAYARADEEEKYSDKYDHLDVDELLKNDRLRNQYYNCFIDAGPCVTPDAIFFKGIYNPHCSRGQYTIFSDARRKVIYV